MPAGALQAYGEVSLAGLELWDPAGSSYGASAPSVLQGQEAGVRATLLNGHAYPSELRVELTVIAPDGSSATLTGEAATVAAGATASWEARWTCSQAGTYRVSAGVYERFQETPAGWWLLGVATVDAATAASPLQRWLPLIELGVVLTLLGIMAHARPPFLRKRQAA